MDDELIIYVADAGSVSKGNFHWVSSRNAAESSHDPRALAEAVANDLNSAKRVALGYEAPPFVPADPNAGSLGHVPRDGECEQATGNRPFTAGAGRRCPCDWHPIAGLGSPQNQGARPQRDHLYPLGRLSLRCLPVLCVGGILSGSEKAYPPSHSGDAVLAISAFRQVSSNKVNPTRIRCSAAFSLAGAAVLWSGMSENLDLLKVPCVVLRPLFSEQEAQGRLAGYKLRQAEAAKSKAAKKRGSSK